VQATAAEGGQDRGLRSRHDRRELLRHALEAAFTLDEAVLVESFPAHHRTVPPAAV
jgi:hypothetical protein